MDTGLAHNNSNFEEPNVSELNDTSDQVDNINENEFKANKVKKHIHSNAADDEVKLNHPKLGNSLTVET